MTDVDDPYGRLHIAYFSMEVALEVGSTGRDRASHGGRTSFEIPLEAATAPAVAAATADALGRLADVLATQAECMSPHGGDLAK